MLDPTMVGGTPGGDPAAGGDPGGDPAAAGGGDPAAAAGGAPQELTTQQMIDSVAKVMGADAEGMTEEQDFRIRQEARNMVTDIQSAVGDELPDATRSQVNQLVDGIMNTDPIRIINAVRDALKVTDEKQSNARKQSSGKLNIQGTGAGKGGEKVAPKSMAEAVVSAARQF